jgi:arginase family enzyme
MDERIKVFGAALDPLDGRDRVEIKRAYLSALLAGIDLEPNFRDPYEGICSVAPSLFERDCEKAGKVPIETWLSPKPQCEDLPKVTSDNYRAFLESNGCLTESEKVVDFVKACLPVPFLMIGVDHSQTGGAVRALSEHYGPAQISLIVLDAHTDMFDFNLLYTVQSEFLRRLGLGNRLPETLYSNNFYGCGNFLESLLEERVIFPRNLFLIGATDYPFGWADSGDPHLKSYIEAYKGILKRGVNIIPKAEVESNNGKLPRVLSTIKTPYVYVSVDMDVGAFLSTCAVRFLNTAGMAEQSLYRTIRIVKDVIKVKDVRCIGLDLMELDVHHAGYFINGERDRGYEIASNIIGTLLPGPEPLAT